MSNSSQTSIIVTLVTTLIVTSPAVAQHGFGGGHGHGGGSAAGWAALGIGIAQGLRSANQNRNSHNNNYSNNQGVFRGNTRNNNNYNNNYSNNHSNNGNYYQPNNNGNYYQQPQANNHYQPAVQPTYVVPQNHAPPRANYSQPQTAATVPPANVAPPVNVAPAAHAEPVANVKPPANLPPAATQPHKNELKLVGRPLTAEEHRRAKEYFAKRMKELIRTILARLPAVEYDRHKLVTMLVAQDVPADTQVRLLDAIQHDDYNTAHDLWLINCTSVEPPFHLSRLRRRLTDFSSRWDSGQALPTDLALLEQELSNVGLETVTCCGAPSLLEEIENTLMVSQAIAQANPGQQSQMLPVPAGDVDIVAHPNLPDGETIVLNQQTVMMGTGGIGTFQMQHGNVAQVQGYPLLPGPGVQASDDRLIQSGILIENPSDSPVQFTLDKQPFSLTPGASQLFTGESRTIAFNTGERNQVTTYALPAATYRFETPNRKWAIHRVKAFEATIDNTHNKVPFGYIAQGEHQEIAAGAVAKHTSAYPIILRFDRGNGANTKQIASNQKEATFSVGINPQDNLWDLYDSAAITSYSVQPGGAPQPAGAPRPAF